MDLPVADADPQREEQLEARPQLSSHVLRRHLGGKHWDQHGRGTDSQSGDDSAGVENPEGVSVDDL